MFKVNNKNSRMTSMTFPGGPKGNIEKQRINFFNYSGYFHAII